MAEGDILAVVVAEELAVTLVAAGVEVEHRMRQVVEAEEVVPPVEAAVVLPRILRFILRQQAERLSIRRRPLHMRKLSIAHRPSVIRLLPPGLPGPAQRTSRILEPAPVLQQRCILRGSRVIRPWARGSAPPGSLRRLASAGRIPPQGPDRPQSPEPRAHAALQSIAQELPAGHIPATR